LNSIPPESLDLDEKVLHRRGTPVLLESGLRLMLHLSHTSPYREKDQQPGIEGSGEEALPEEGNGAV
jgi:hypothetical protein